MRVVGTGTTHGFQYIPRTVPSGTITVKVRSASQNKVLETVTADTNSYSNGKAQVIFTVTEDFVEGQMYNIDVLDDGNLLWRGLVYCTDQTDYFKYTATSGEFTEYEGNNNEFIVLDD